MIKNIQIFIEPPVEKISEGKNLHTKFPSSNTLRHTIYKLND